MFYLKYRPQTISELDNEKIRASLGEALLANKWAHAYLLTGPKGTGKTTTARLIAKIVNCTNRSRGDEPCNRCSSCKAITAGTSLDVIEIDAASNTGVDDIRDLREKAKLAPTSSKYKVYIIDEVHMLSTSAFNALLKILEEPPEHVIFVLATTDPQKIPATVISRCLVYNFGETSKQDIVHKLRKIVSEEKIRVDEAVLVQIVETVGTSHRDAQKLLEQLSMASANRKIADFTVVTTQTPDNFASQILKEIDLQNSKKALELVDQFVKVDGKLKELIAGLILILRNNLLSKSESLDERTVFLINKLITANALMIDSPVPQLPLEMAIIEFCSDKSEKSDESDRLKLRISESSDFSETWPAILAAVKPYNHSLVAFLRASRPMDISGDSLTLEVFYKFHKEKLEEHKNRETLEKVISDIIGRPIKVKFVLAQKK